MYEDDVEQEVQELEEQEREHVTAFVGMTRLSCFAHTLQLVVAKFNTSKQVSAVLKQVFAIVRKYNKSKNATERLEKECGVKLVGLCPTRWSSTFLVVERLLRVHEGLNKVLSDLGWDCVQTSDWTVLETMKSMLEPFAAMTKLTSGEMYVTLLSVLYYVILIRRHLERAGSTLNRVGETML